MSFNDINRQPNKAIVRNLTVNAMKLRTIFICAEYPPVYSLSSNPPIFKFLTRTDFVMPDSLSMQSKSTVCG